jgi:secreted PhoX family phosphatase
MNKRLLTLFPLTAVAAAVGLAVTGCGGDGSDSTSSSTSTGVLLDSAVQGVTYTSSACPSGCTTNEKGEFTYRAGDTVTFKIGALEIGEANGAAKLFLNDLTGETNLLGQKAVNLARLLQSLDADGNPENGIDVRNKTVADGCGIDSEDKLLSCGVELKPIDEVVSHLAETAESESEITSVTFSATPAPTTVADMAKTFTSSVATVTYADGTTKDFPLEYVTLFSTKDKVGTSQHAAGQLFNARMEPLTDALGQPVIAETPDANSLLKIGDKLFLVTHYEYDWLVSDGSDAPSRMPMSMTLTEVSQDKTTGKLTAVDQKPIDFSSVDGLWIPCFGSQTPWNTHLGSEEDYDLQYNPLSSKYDSKTTAGLAALTEKYFSNEKDANPYHYGFIPEVEVKEDGSYRVVKHYAMGRGTWEMAKIMPDGKTVYFGDDGTHGLMAMFVADKAGNLDAGTLYAAKWIQVSELNGGEAVLKWVKLGHATSDEVKALADDNTFDSIFDAAAPVDGACADGYTRVRTGSTADECIKLKEGMETAAAFLETRRYAALKGATTEFTKMEGVAVNAKDKKLYMAMSSIRDSMTSMTGEPADHIKLSKNSAGATYTLDLKSGQTDADGNPIDSAYVAASMYVEPALLGKPISVDAKGNTADENSIANPDNIFFSEKMRTLFIGEDSGMHVNNYVWAYNVDTKTLTRILSAAAGAENTGLQVVDDMEGHAYIMSNNQHWGDLPGTVPADLKSQLEAAIDVFHAPVGYIGGLPAIE